MNKVTDILQNVSSVIIGKNDVAELVMTSIIAGGHILLEDVPGTGKTMMAKAFARSIDGEFSRIQFTPDLLPSDILGLNYFSQKEGEFIFRKGPVFTSVLLADEINRATPRTQSSLLECMEEHQVTIDGETRKLSDPFFVIATENPIETAGTYPLPEAQTDRFFMVLEMGYPTKSEEIDILSRFSISDPLDTLESVCSKEDLDTMKKEADEVYIHPDVLMYIASISEATREKEGMGISPRGTIALMRGAKAWAMLEGYDYVTPSHVKKVAPYILSHRMGKDINRGRKEINSILSSLPVPTEEWGERQ